VSSEQRISLEVHERAAKVRLLALDVDGTLTDGRLWFGSAGEQFKAFHVQDGLGMKLLQQAGIEIAWITARRSDIVSRRAADLGIVRVDQGCDDKARALHGHCAELGLALNQVAYMGDDLPDRPALRMAGLAVVPANAHPWVAAVAHWKTVARGGEGAVRELCDLLLVTQGRRDTLLGGFGG
jgi:3-deoxy-D-manno-octulosonate 8-phosphate phosphatase (KDO 8-P phosphatase)